MSWEATAYIKGLRVDPAGVPITRTEKMVLFVLSDCINPYTGQGWIEGGLQALAAEALISKPGLLATLKRLQERKLLSKEMQCDGAGRSRTNIYVFIQMPLKSDKGKAALPLKLPRNEAALAGYAHKGEGKVRVDSQGVKPELTVGVKSDLTVGVKPDFTPSYSSDSLRTLKTPPTPPQAGAGVHIGQAEEILTELNRLTGMHFKTWHPNGALTANGRLVLAALGKGYTADQLVRVIRIKHKGWWGGEMQKYLRPKTLFAPENFDQYVAGLSDKPLAVAGPARPARGPAECSPVPAPRRGDPVGRPHEGEAPPRPYNSRAGSADPASPGAPVQTSGLSLPTGSRHA